MTTTTPLGVRDTSQVAAHRIAALLLGTVAFVTTG
jgi:hypothetical protein